MTLPSRSGHSKVGSAALAERPTCALTLDSSNVRPPANAPTKLAPGHPQAAVACRYAGSSEDTAPGVLDASAQVPATDVEQLAHDMNSGGRPPEGKHLCLEDDGAQDVVKFAYAASPTITVVISLTGCAYALTAPAAATTTQNTFSMLNQLVGPDPNPRFAPQP